jgi:hypothetical protein
MLINNEKLNIDTPNVGAKDDLVKTSASNNKDVNAKVSEIGLSQSGQNLNYLFQVSLSTAKQNPSPVYIGAEKRVELLSVSVNDIAKKSGHEYTPEQINRVVEDVKKEVNIQEMKPGDASANAGSVYSFLSSTDKANLADAYQYALDNNTSLKDVAIAAGSLGRARYVEAKISSGTTYSYYKPEEQQNAGTSDSLDQKETDKTERAPKTDYFKLLMEQLNKDELFASNPFLRSALIQDVSSANLQHSIPFFLKDKITEIAD